MTANWTPGVRWQYPKGYGDVEPMLAQTATNHGNTVPLPKRARSNVVCARPCSSDGYDPADCIQNGCGRFR